MKNFLVSIFLAAGVFSLPSCGSSKEGCGLEEKYNNPDMETTKRGKSTLFSKKQTKRMKKKS